MITASGYLSKDLVNVVYPMFNITEVKKKESKSQILLFFHIWPFTCVFRFFSCFLFYWQLYFRWCVCGKWFLLESYLGGAAWGRMVHFMAARGEAIINEDNGGSEWYFLCKLTFKNRNVLEVQLINGHFVVDTLWQKVASFFFDMEEVWLCEESTVFWGLLEVES